MPKNSHWSLPCLHLLLCISILQVILDPSLLSVSPSFFPPHSPFLPHVVSSLPSITDMEKRYSWLISLGWRVGARDRELTMLCRLYNPGFATSSSIARLLSAWQSLWYFPPDCFSIIVWRMTFNIWRPESELMVNVTCSRSKAAVLKICTSYVLHQLGTQIDEIFY